MLWLFPESPLEGGRMYLHGNAKLGLAGRLALVRAGNRA
jgi:hypothetical protein